MRNLKTIEGKVKAILEKDEEARNDDMLLSQGVQYLFERHGCNALCRGNVAVPLSWASEH